MFSTTPIRETVKRMQYLLSDMARPALCDQYLTGSNHSPNLYKSARKLGQPMIRINLLNPRNLFGLCSEIVTPEKKQNSDISHRDITVSPPQGLTIVRGLVSAKFSVRVLAYLSEAERRTEVAHEQEIYRIAWLTVLRADEGDPDPWRTAFWQIVGNTPEKAIPFWMARADLFADPYVPLSMLDLKYTKEWASDYLRAKAAGERAREAGLPPKKAPESVRVSEERRSVWKSEL